MNGDLDATAHPACRCNKMIVHASAVTPHLHYDLQDRTLELSDPVSV